MATSVFISYSHFDAALAQELVKLLSDIGVDCFLDEKEIEWGDEVPEKVKVGLRSCSALIVILSPASLKSQWVPFEVGQATALGKKVLPFLTHPALDVPPFLRQLKYKSDLEDVRTYFRDVFAVRSEADPDHLRKITPKERDSIRAERNTLLIEALKHHEGITGCDVWWLNDHTDNGFLVNVDFDDRQSAAEVLSLIRRTFEELFPDVPIVGKMEAESDSTVSFKYIYIDEYHKRFKRSRR